MSRFVEFDRNEWAALRAQTPLTLSEQDLADLKGISDRLDLAEVEAVYLPLTRLLNLYVAATQDLFRATDTFLGKPPGKVPYIIGIAGSVAVGKSTTSRVLQALLSRWPDHPTVDLVTTDGFLYDNATLIEKNLMHRKGFPESYDRKRLVDFLARLKGGERQAHAPVYSHEAYDIVPGEHVTVRQPDILIIEGLNVLQAAGAAATGFVSDFFDFSLYVDADERDIEAWYVERFLTLRDTVFKRDHAFFARYADLTDDEADREARMIWRTINGINLHENIAPTRERAHLILEKGPDHAVRRVFLRKI